MTLTKQFVIAFLAIYCLNIGAIRAQLMFEKEDKIEKYLTPIAATNDQQVLAHTLPNSRIENVSSVGSTKNNLSLSIKKLESISQVELEEEILLEKWMSNINDDLWVTDSEESLEIESWMFDSAKWLNKEKSSISKAFKSCPLEG